MEVRSIIEREGLSKEDIITLLRSEGNDRDILFQKSGEIRDKYAGKKVWLRGLIEFSNICSKNCLYCGIRKGNRNISRYNLTDEEILKAAAFAYEKGFGSVALQSGELESRTFTNRIESLIRKIKNLSDGKLGITLSVGEQEKEVYQKWFDAGAHRYLLRMEATNPGLYSKIHPSDTLHDFSRRLNCLESLKNIGYQTGTGVMIGLPFQTYDDLAGDLLFMKEFDIDMCGMGPYIEHADTPFIKYSYGLPSLAERLDLSLKMIAVLRLIMKDINIVASTALQSIDPEGREKAVRIGANIIMPNITPGKYRDSYKLYENKPCSGDSDDDCLVSFEENIKAEGFEVIYREWGDSKHYFIRSKSEDPSLTG
jgi:biotin synthase